MQRQPLGEDALQARPRSGSWRVSVWPALPSGFFQQVLAWTSPRRCSVDVLSTGRLLTLSEAGYFRVCLWAAPSAEG